VAREPGALGALARALAAEHDEAGAGDHRRRVGRFLGAGSYFRKLS
jgi:hypothetical protein